MEQILSGEEPRVRRPVLGYAMVLAAAATRGINGTVSKGILDAGLSSPRLTELTAKSPQIAKKSILYKPGRTPRKVQKLSALQVGLARLPDYGPSLTS